MGWVIDRKRKILLGCSIKLCFSTKINLRIYLRSLLVFLHDFEWNCGRFLANFLVHLEYSHSKSLQKQQISKSLSYNEIIIVKNFSSSRDSFKSMTCASFLYLSVMSI